MKRWAAIVALAALFWGCDGGGSEEEGATSTTAAGDPSRAETALYFTTGEQFRKVERELPQAGSELEQATKALVEGPTSGEQRARIEAQTQIPEAAEVNDVTLSDDGTAVVDVSSAFMAGVPADAAKRSRAEEAELNARLGQLTYTLTQFDKVESAKVVSGGVAVETGLERDDYARPARGPKRPERPRGAKSASTRKLQQRLAELQYLPRSAVDGVDDYRTQQAVIAFQSWEGLERDGIVGPQTTAALARAKPPQPRGGGPDRRVEVDRDRGVALLVAHGRTKRAIHVSTGAPGTATPAGTFEVFRKELRSWSVPFGVWLPYASYFNAGIAFHEYPDVPTYPASHGCVRVPAPEAQIVYRFAKIGTAVVVL